MSYGSKDSEIKPYDLIQSKLGFDLFSSMDKIICQSYLCQRT